MKEEMLAVSERLREFTALKYMGDCKCGRCQLVPKELVDHASRLLRVAAVFPQDSDASHVPTKEE